jgi:hypothetical protein
LPAPANDTDEVIVRACVCPTRDAEDMDAILASTYYIEIASGAIAQLCASPNKPYTNPDVSAYRAAKFEAGVVAA